MPDLTAKQANFVSRAIVIIDDFVTAQDNLNDLRAEYDALDYGNTLPPGAFVGDNAHLVVADVAAAMTSQGAIEAVMAAGHRTNFLKVRR